MFVKTRRKKPVAPRRVPTQSRGRERVELLLDAAAQVFDAVGYEAATTNAIAARAGVPIGSLYQYFPNKEALLHALAERYRDETVSFFEAMTSPELLARPLHELIDQLVDGIVASHRLRPGFRTLMVGIATSGELAVGANELHRTFQRRTVEMLAVRTPHLSPADRERVATVAVHIADLLRFLPFQKGEAAQQRWIEETKTLLLRYLEPYDRPAKTRPARTR